MKKLIFALSFFILLLLTQISLVFSQSAVDVKTILDDSGVIYDDTTLNDNENNTEMQIVIKYTDMESYKKMSSVEVADITNKIKSNVHSSNGRVTYEYKLFPFVNTVIPKSDLKSFSKLLNKTKSESKMYLVGKTYTLLHEAENIIDAPEFWSLQTNPSTNITGKGAIIAILDTGFDHSQPDLNTKILNEWDFVNSDGHAEDNAVGHHGTLVAKAAAGGGIIQSQGSDVMVYGVAPQAKLLIAKVQEGNSGYAEGNIAAGIDWALFIGADVISLSIGKLGNSAVMEEAVKEAVNTYNTPVVVAAGDCGPGGYDDCCKLWYNFCIIKGDKTIITPGIVEEAITVGASDKTDHIWVGSSRGPPCETWTSICPYCSQTYVYTKPDLVVPGASIGIPYLDADGIVYQMFVSGTSISAPMVAGAVALLHQLYPQLTPGAIKALLERRTVDIGYGTNIQGSGRLKLEVDCSASRYDMDNGTCTYYCGMPATSKCLGRHISDGASLYWECLSDGTASPNSNQQCWCDTSCNLFYDGCEQILGADYRCDEFLPGQRGSCPSGTLCSSDCQCVVPNSCTDSDGGLMYYTKGTVSGYQNSVAYSYTDRCAGTATSTVSGDPLTEYYCIGTSWASSTYYCSSRGSDWYCLYGECRAAVSKGRFHWKKSITDFDLLSFAVTVIAISVIFGVSKLIAKDNLIKN